MTNEDQLKTSPGPWVKIFRNNLQSQEVKELFRKTKKVLIKIYKIYHIYCLANYLRNLFPGLQDRPKCQTVQFFFAVPTIGEIPWEHFHY